jgi:hypothetical protein
MPTVDGNTRASDPDVSESVLEPTDRVGQIWYAIAEPDRIYLMLELVERRPGGYGADGKYIVVSVGGPYAGETCFFGFPCGPSFARLL